jgi:Methyltransferase FkbM domain
MGSRDFPIVRANRVIRQLEPFLSRIGVLQPVRIEVDPGVSLLLDPAENVARTILISRQGNWEPEAWAAISSGLEEGAVFVDVGAHLGYDSLKAARLVGEKGRVIAFEPSPNTLMLLRSNIEASEARNIIVQPVASTDSEQTLTLFDSTLRGRPIDDVVSELGLTRVDVLKADVEGAELMVLRGAAQTLRRFHPKLILEVVPDSSTT